MDEAVSQSRSAGPAREDARDARMTKPRWKRRNTKHEQEHRALMVAMEEKLDMLQKRLSMFTMLRHRAMRTRFRSRTMKPGSLLARSRDALLRGDGNRAFREQRISARRKQHQR